MGRAPNRPRQELLALFAEQRAALAASCEGFDKGSIWEAPRLATSVFTLVHDGGSITSLLTQLGLRASLRFISSGRFPKHDKGKVVSSSPPLLMMTIDQNGARFAPRFGEKLSQEIVQFQTWWTKEEIHKQGALSLTRQRRVFSLRHQDGGGHVGTLTDPAYVNLKAGAGWFGGSNQTGFKLLDGAAAASMRQVAWELSETLATLGEVK